MSPHPPPAPCNGLALLWTGLACRTWLTLFSFCCLRFLSRNAPRRSTLGVPPFAPLLSLAPFLLLPASSPPRSTVGACARLQAHEVQAGKLAEAAGRAVAARREVVAENAALASALAAAQHSTAVYAQQLLPLLAPHGLTPPPADPPAVAAAVATLVDRLAAEINLLQVRPRRAGAPPALISPQVDLVVCHPIPTHAK